MLKTVPPWLKRYHSELYHYGVKGMKWGIRRTPEELGHKPKKGIAKSSANDTIVKDAVRSGRVRKEINREKQIRHCKWESGYIQGRSYIDGDLKMAQKLVDTLSGTGTPICAKDGTWVQKERVIASDRIGVHVNNETGTETRTNKLVITYSKTGTHIMPGKEERKIK